MTDTPDRPAPPRPLPAPPGHREPPAPDDRPSAAVVDAYALMSQQQRAAFAALLSPGALAELTAATEGTDQP